MLPKTSMMIDFNVRDLFVDRRRRDVVTLWFFVLVASCLHGQQRNSGSSAVLLPETYRSGTTGNSGNIMGYVHAGNIANFTSCTIIEGGLDFINKTFNGDKFLRVGKMSPDQLEALAGIVEIRDYLKVNAYHENFTTMSFLGNLQVINGQKTTGGGSWSSLIVLATSLRSLGLVSLTQIKNGSVNIKNNGRLCYAERDMFDWPRLLPKPEQNVDVSGNQNKQTCEADGAVCSSLCSSLRGCWGPGDDQCVMCIDYRRSDTRQCLKSCRDQPRLYTNNDTRECLPCHEECRTGCIGPGPSNCDACLHLRDGPYCLAECPPFKYSEKNGVCQPCHPNCDQESGCTGPGAHLGYGGCKECVGLVYHQEEGIGSAECLNSTQRDCEIGSYYFGGSVAISSSEDEDIEDRRVISRGCRKCDPMCERCSASGPMCDVCKFYRFVTDQHCIDRCSLTVYPSFLKLSADPLKAREKGRCMRCHPECRECSGRLKSDCRRCENKKIYVDRLLSVGGKELVANYGVSVNDSFFCYAVCPQILDKVVIERHPGYVEEVCFNKDSLSVPKVWLSCGKICYVSITAVFVVLLGAAVVVVIYLIHLCRQLSESEKQELNLHAQLNGLEHQRKVGGFKTANDYY